MSNEERITYIGTTDARNKRVQFGIKDKDRTKHVYVIGKTGMGKSTLLENMAIQDIQNGEGLAFVDPHGASAEKLLDYIPEERIKDVLYFAPFDLEYPISFNILDDIGADKRHLVVNGLMSTFEKLWVDMWSARMAYILQNTIQALLEYPDSTLLGVNRVLIDKAYRKKIVDNVTDPAVKAFWTEEFAKYTDRYTQEATPAIQNKVGQFVSNPLIRNVIGQPNSAFDIREIMDNKKILIVNLAKGKVGEGNANLLGGMLITRIYLAAMSRADASEAELEKLPHFNLYVDEFQSFANKTFENILSEARKYKLNLTIAHQYIEQMEEEVRNAVFGNVGTMITFRVGAFDAEVLEKEFEPTFYAQDLVNLGVYQIYLKLMIDGVSSQPFSATTMPSIEQPQVSYKEQIIAWTREHYGKPRALVEEDIKKWHEMAFTAAQEEVRPQRGDRPPSFSSRPGGQGERRRERPQERRTGAPQRSDYPKRSTPRQEERVPHRGSAPAPFAGNKQTISLKDLKAVTAERVGTQARRDKPRSNTGKDPTPKHRGELRDALADVLKAQPSAESKASKEEKKPADVRGSTSNVQGQTFTKQKEIPEDELRKMLDVEGEKQS